MAEVNQVIISGGVVADPELRTVGAKNTAMLNLRIVYTKKRKQGDDWLEDKSYFTAVLWGELATRAASNLKKGSQVVVTGSLQQREYNDKDGNKRNSVEISATDISIKLPSPQRQLIPDDPTGGDLDFLND